MFFTHYLCSMKIHLFFLQYFEVVNEAILGVAR